jgi:large subunit ribosomal protein L49
MAQRWRFSTSIPKQIETIKVDSTSPSEAALSSSSYETHSQSSDTPTLSDAIPSSRFEPSQPSGSLLRYHVSRTPANNLPVYHDTRNGNTRKETIIRKITGDPAPLRDAIRDLLELKEDRIWVGKVTGHVYVKGHHKGVIEQFLAEKGF